MNKKLLLFLGMTICLALSARAETFPSATKTYTLHRFGNTSAYMYEDGGQIATGTYDITKRCFWQFVPTANDGCFYIRNAVSGNYVQSTKISLSGLVQMGTSPVEFKVAKDNTAAASTNGYYYLCSTDQANISNATDGTLGLNFGTSGVCAYYIKTGRGNSYWEIVETTDEYEIQPFEAVENISDTPAFLYSLFTPDQQQAVTAGSGSATLQNRTDAKNEAWYFVGTSNNGGGYQIASNSQQGYTLNYTDGQVVLSQSATPTKWYVRAVAQGANTLYTFTPFDQKNDEDAPLLTIGTTNQFLIRLMRSEYTKNIGVYNLPCGTAGNNYLALFHISGSGTQKELTYSAAAAPSSYYTIYTEDKATVTQGKPFGISHTISHTEEGQDVHLYFDWNGDGIFETAYYDLVQLTDGRDYDVPADAKLGKTRARVRITSNGLTDAEDDVTGFTYDFIVNVAAPIEAYTVTAKSNAEERGTVTMEKDGATVADNITTGTYGDQITLTATPKGTAEFVCWKDGNEIVSTNAVYNLTLTQCTDLVAYFSPNTDTGETGINSVGTDKQNFLYTLASTDKTLCVETEATVKNVLVFNANGTLVAKSSRKKITLKNQPEGLYIVKVCTAEGDGSQKVIIK